MENIRPYYDFELRELDNNVGDGEIMAALIRNWHEHVLALFFIPTDQKDSDSRISLIAAQRVGTLSPRSFQELIEICPNTEGKYFTSMLLIRHPHKPLEHTLTLAFNTRFVSPEAFSGVSDEPFDYSNTELHYGEASLAIKALIKYAPQANLVFLSNAPVWKDVDSIKDEMWYHVESQIRSRFRLRIYNPNDYYAGEWLTEY
jgi:hypothetical protein